MPTGLFFSYSITIRYSMVVLVFSTILLAAAPPVSSYEAEHCIACHSLESSESRLQISVKDFHNSAHGRSFTCLDCHTGIENDLHITLPGSGRVDCGQCHDQINLHGISQQSEYRPQCYHCHTKHVILSAADEQSSIFAGNLHKTCRSCHPVPCGRTGALSWLPSITIASHRKQDFSQSYSNKNCIGCHQGNAAHGNNGVLNNQLCYVCHAPLGEIPLLAGPMHLDAEAPDQPLSRIVGILYAAGLAILVFGGFRHWFFRSTYREES